MYSNRRKKRKDKTVCKLRIVEVGSEAHRGYFEYALTNEIVVDCSLNRDKGRLESPRKKESWSRYADMGIRLYVNECLRVRRFLEQYELTYWVVKWWCRLRVDRIEKAVTQLTRRQLGRNRKCKCRWNAIERNDRWLAKIWKLMVSASRRLYGVCITDRGWSSWLSW